jgi:AraC-like DNA-binding protein
MNFNKPMRVELLAQTAALSVSAFHRHFKAVTAMSPLQFQKRLRLLQARSLLIAAQGGVPRESDSKSVTKAPRSSAANTRFFGWPPAEDDARIRHALQLKTPAGRKGAD